MSKTQRQPPPPKKRRPPPPKIPKSQILKWENGWHDPAHHHIAWSYFPAPKLHISVKRINQLDPLKSQTLAVWQLQEVLSRHSPLREVQVIVMIDEVPLVMDITKVQDGPGFFCIIAE